MNQKKISTKNLITISILSAIAFLLMFLRTPIPIAPNFMDLDVSELPGLIASFSIGPLAGFLVTLLKIILKTVFQGTTTAYVGELSNLIVSSSMVVTAGLIYKQNKTLKTAIFALIMGTLSMSIIACLSNYFVIFPMYGKIMGIELDTFADTVKEINPLVKDFKSLIIYSIFPFNVIKGGVTSLLSFLLYKRIGKYIKNN